MSQPRIITTDHFILHLFPDGSVRLWPPMKWTAELLELLENKTISNDASKTVLEQWQQDMLPKVHAVLTRLQTA